ncbi:hypothetical protein A6U86_05700 [Rhizobium sp. AC27/96]|uniref:hypothetical protein n=1 Tax=Rhizobium sp. AC27/96 TaxID=1841653 RepID=UPI0008292E53|nr:hypothetical protein [Rhizobium sp. AC27/96]OCJ12517.1 hypothetical protein A6U86_05700 [Rhizobium sp. AC27/96]
MADIIESLRSMTEPAGFHSYHDNGVRILEMTCKPNSTAHEAADEIISLRAERDASKALCDEMAKEIERLRDANRKLHRRAQLGEGLFATVKFDLEMWITTLSSPPRDTSSWLFRYALRHMERAVGRYHQKIEQAGNTSSQEILNG